MHILINLFFEAIDREIKIDNPEYIFNKFYKGYEKDMYCADRMVDIYIKEIILKDHFKDICVQYLGYDSLERFSPNGRRIKVPHREWLITKGPTNFQKTPRIITSSAPNPKERFYNYLLMDWDVHILPRYMFNEQTGMYEKEPEYLGFHYSDKEEILAKEIASIKKLVPLEDRPKYFR